MAVENGGGNNRISDPPCFCYIGSPINTILDSDQISALENSYVLGEHLGWGQFGIIRTCTDKLTGEVLACKSIAKEKLATMEDLQSVKLEIQVMSRLSGHPNVVDLKAVYEEQDYVHLVMELCAGGELFHQLEKHGKFSETEARVLFRHLMEVVMYCHDNGVVHRDLKPENILLVTKESSSPIKLADFGLATYIKPGQNLYGTVGSPFYIAPEVLTGGYNQAADVWSAGVILYILLSGVPPFWGKTKSRIFDAVRTANLRFPSNPWDQVSASSKDLITRMLCKDPSQRLTAAQVLDHSWLKNDAQVAEELQGHDNPSSGQLHKGDGSFPTAIIARNQDVSFTSGSPVCVDAHAAVSPAFTCRSSFSSFLNGASTPCLTSGGFSFRSCDDSTALEFSSPVRAMPSFAFFSPSSAAVQEKGPLGFDANMTRGDAIQREAGLEKLFILPYSSLCVGRESAETKDKVVEVQRAGGAAGSRVLAILSRRNRTIGLGEHEQLDLMATESFFRWASCTHVPSAPSLRLSLVC